MFEFLEKLYEDGVEVNVSLSFNKNRKRVESLINTYENFSKNKKGVYVEPKENPLKNGILYPGTTEPKEKYVESKATKLIKKPD